MNPIIMPAIRAIPSLMLAFKDTFKAELITHLSEKVPFTNHISPNIQTDIFDFLEASPSDFLLIEDNYLTNGSLGFLKKLTRINPSTKVIIYAQVIESDYLKVFQSSPAVGFIQKNCTVEIFVNCLKNIFLDKRIIFPGMNDFQKTNQSDRQNSDKIDPSDFTEREMEVWVLLKRGKSQIQMATILSIEVSSIKTHINNMSKKLQLPQGSRLSKLAIINDFK